MSPNELDSDKLVWMWYTALGKERALPGRCLVAEC
jgi:hypothetical protein